MRAISPEMAERLAAPTGSLCTCWRFVRADGRVFGATDHDRTIEWEGVVYSPAHGLSGAELIWGDGLAPGRAYVEGGLETEFITEADLAAGRWDGARVDIWRVDWRDLAARLRLWSGRLSDVTRSGAAFRAELVSLKADLERTIGRVYARACDAEVGDARCGMDLGRPEYHAEGVVIAVGAGRVTAGGLSGFADGWFSSGVATWLDGASEGRQARVILHAGEALDLAGPMGAAGDRFRVTVGCDKSFAMCGGRFGNRVRFRGFPHMPGPDFVLSGPKPGASGGRRA